jgi:hypothetical protein
MNELTKVEQLLKEIIAEREKAEEKLLEQIEEINRLVS